jgi:hypothetical protein
MNEDAYPNNNQQINRNILIEFGFRGENIKYQDNEKTVEITFTWMNGPRLDTDTIDRWKDGSEISDNEKKEIFRNTLQFISTRFPKSIIEINKDDKSRNIWEESCTSMSSLIENIEYTSDEERYQIMKHNYLETMKRTKIIINGQQIEDEKQLDIALEKFARKHRKS